MSDDAENDYDYDELQLHAENGASSTVFVQLKTLAIKHLANKTKG